MTRRIRILLALLAVPIVVLAIMWYWLLHTAPGAAFVWSQLQNRVPGELHATNLEGDFASQFVLNGLRFENSSIAIDVESMWFAIDVDLLPLTFTFLSPEARTINMRLTDTENDRDQVPTSLEDVFSALQLPLTIAVENLQVADVMLESPGGSETLLWSSLSLSATLADELAVESVSASTPYATVSADGFLELRSPYSAALNADVTVIDIGVDQVAGATLEVYAKGDNRRLDVGIDIDEPHIAVSGHVVNFLARPIFELELRAAMLRRSMQDSDATFVAKDTTATVSGTSQDFRLQAESTLSVPGYDELAVGVEGTGSPSHFVVNQLRIHGDRTEAVATGVIDWSSQLSVDGDVTLARLDLDGWLDAWPEAHPVSGRLVGRWRGESISLQQLEIEVPAAGLSVAGNGNIDPATGIVDGALEWNGMRWPLDADTPAFGSDDGNIAVRGSLSAWTVDGRISVHSGSLPAGELTFRGEGDRDSVAIKIDDGGILGGRVAGEGSFSWRGEKPFKGKLAIAGLRPESVVPDWPGHISAEVALRGMSAPFRLEAGIRNLEGELRGASLTGRGGLQIGANEIEFRDLRLQHAGSVVALDGSLRSRAGVSYQLNIEDLQLYANELSGSIHGSGEISLHPEDPRIRTSLSAESLQGRDFALESLIIEDNADANSDLIDQRLIVRGLQLGGQTIDSATLTASGNAEQHRLDLELNAIGIEILATTSGAIAGWTELSTVKWHGLLERLSLDFPRVSALTLQSPTVLSLSANAVEFEKFCLSGDDNSKLCLLADWDRRSRAEFAATLQKIPLSDIASLLETDLDFTQTVSGSVEWSAAANESSAGTADIQISPGQIFSKSDPSLTMDTGVGAFGFDLTDSKLAAGYFDLPVPGSGQIDIDFSLGYLDRRTGSQLEGTVLIDLRDVGAVAELIPGVERVNGRVSTDLTLAGTPAAPIVDGSLSVHDAELEFEPLGLVLADVNVDAKIIGSRHLDLEGHFRAGDGVGQIRSNADYSVDNTTGFEIELTGKDLTLIDTPQLTMVVEPDVTLSVRDKELQIGGKVLLPRVHFEPAEAPTARVSESEDVVIVAGERFTEVEKADDDQGITMNGDLQIEFGKNVEVDLGVATATLGGFVDFTWEHDLLPIANGAYTINGSIAVFGQVLTISEGVVRFPNTPANNPHLNIRAEREIFGNSQIKTAGVLVTGTVEVPVVEAYTYPLTTEERALTLLATGSDFDYEQGVGALEFGTYIAPKFFLSYGIGVFDRQNVISLRYDLKKGFGVKATSGERESGFDVSYRFEH